MYIICIYASMASRGYVIDLNMFACLLFRKEDVILQDKTYRICRHIDDHTCGTKLYNTLVIDFAAVNKSTMNIPNGNLSFRSCDLNMLMRSPV